MNKKIIILHIFHDDKFFDSVSDFFDSLSNTENKYIYYSKSDFQFKYIRKIEKITIVSEYHEYIKWFSDKTIDIIFFHSLPSDKYFLFKYIDKLKIIIWWAWGYDIYSSCLGLPPLIKLNLFKPKTENLIRNLRKKKIIKYNVKEFIFNKDMNLFFKIKCILRKLFYILKSFSFKNLQQQVISRIDYFLPVLPIEYEIMKSSVPFFSAKPFMLSVSPSKTVFPLYYKNNTNGNILIGNSLTYENNHLDIFEMLCGIKLAPGRRFVVPVNYGNDYNSDPYYLKRISNMSEDTTVWLTEFLQYNEYKKIIKKCSHAIFGHVRQQAMGNIFLCLQNGIKIYLYRDSISYKQLLAWGYCIFSIENDLTVESLNQPLTDKQSVSNFNLLKKRNLSKIENVEKELSDIILLRENKNH